MYFRSLVEPLFFFPLACYGAKKHPHTASPLPSSYEDHMTHPSLEIQEKDIIFTFLVISHTVQCPRSNEWMLSMAILFTVTCRVHVWRVSATWIEDIWINKQDNMQSWLDYLCDTNVWIYHPFHVCPLFICNLIFLKINSQNECYSCFYYQKQCCNVTKYIY